VLAPRLVGPPRFAEEVGEVDVGRGVEITCDVVSRVGQVQRLEELGYGEPAAAAVFGVRVVVEGVVAGLGHLPVADQLGPHYGVHGLQKPGPVFLAVDLAPNLRQWLLFLLFFLLLSGLQS